MPAENENKKGGEPGSALREKIDVERTMPKVDIFAPPPESISLEEVHSMWQRPLHHSGSLSETAAQSAAPKTIPAPTAPAVLSKKIPTW